jgi:hypothetical protein
LIHSCYNISPIVSSLSLIKVTFIYSRLFPNAGISNTAEQSSLLNVKWLETVTNMLLYMHLAGLTSDKSRGYPDL